MRPFFCLSLSFVVDCPLPLFLGSCRECNETSVLSLTYYCAFVHFYIFTGTGFPSSQYWQILRTETDGRVQVRHFPFFPPLVPSYSIHSFLAFHHSILHNRHHLPQWQGNTPSRGEKINEFLRGARQSKLAAGRDNRVYLYLDIRSTWHHWDASACENKQISTEREARSTVPAQDCYSSEIAFSFSSLSAYLVFFMCTLSHTMISQSSETRVSSRVFRMSFGYDVHASVFRFTFGRHLAAVIGTKLSSYFVTQPVRGKCLAPDPIVYLHSIYFCVAEFPTTGCPSLVFMFVFISSFPICKLALSLSFYFLPNAPPASTQYDSAGTQYQDSDVVRCDLNETWLISCFQQQPD